MLTQRPPKQKQTIDMKIVFLDAATLGATSLEPIARLGELQCWQNSTPEEALERVADAEVLIVNKIRVTDELLSRAPKLQLLCEAATGVNNIDLEAARRRGVTVRNVAGYSTDSVVQITFTQLLRLVCDSSRFDSYVKSGDYSRSGLFTEVSSPFRMLAGRTIGIIGLGNIGSRVAKVAEAFGMKVIWYSTSGTAHSSDYPCVGLDELLSRSDVVSVHCPLNARTRNLIGRRELGLMKPEAILMNMARGGIIDEAALSEAVGEGRIYGAAVDVFTAEPLPADNPLLHCRRPERLLLSPHIAWAGCDALDKLVRGIADNIIAERLRREMEKELRDDILPFWEKRMTDGDGSFIGRIDGRGNALPDSPKGGILNARILWTAAAAAKAGFDSGAMADRALDVIRKHFIDREFGGSYWSLDARSRVLEDKKQFYSIAFTVYALAQMYDHCGDPAVLEEACALYRCIEEHSHDRSLGGWTEACTRDWRPIEDMRLSEKDRNDKLTMNTHLHILEAYTGLYRVWKDEGLAENLRELILIFLERIMQEDGHLALFFAEDWTPSCSTVSYGHDIECSWLLAEAAGVLGDRELEARVKEACAKMARAGMEGWTKGKGMIYEYDPESGERDGDRHWWVQAEAVVGCLWQWRESSDSRWLEAAADCWDFIKENLLAPDGEWYWSVRENGEINLDDDRAGFWKCPYHNGRMCLEALSILSV